MAFSKQIVKKAYSHKVGSMPYYFDVQPNHENVEIAKILNLHRFPLSFPEIVPGCECQRGFGCNNGD